MPERDQSALTAAQQRVLRHLPADGDFAVMAFENDLPLGTAWVDGERLYERHVRDEGLFALATLGQRLRKAIDNEG